MTHQLAPEDQQILDKLNDQQKQMLLAAEPAGSQIVTLDVQQRMYPIVRIGGTTFLDESDPELSGAQANEDLHGLVEIGAIELVGKEVYRLTTRGIRLARHLKQRE